MYLKLPKLADLNRLNPRFRFDLDLEAIKPLFGDSQIFERLLKNRLGKGHHCLPPLVPSIITKNLIDLFRVNKLQRPFSCFNVASLIIAILDKAHFILRQNHFSDYSWKVVICVVDQFFSFFYFSFVSTASETLVYDWESFHKDKIKPKFSSSTLYSGEKGHHKTTLQKSFRVKIRIVRNQVK